MQTKYVIVLVLFAVAVLIVLFPGSLSWVLKLFGQKQTKRVVRFGDSIELEWGKYFWEGKAVLSSWAGFQERLGPYGSISGNKPSSGEVQLSVSRPEVGSQSVPSPAQVKAFEYLQKNDEQIRDNVLKAIFDAYPEWRDDFKDFLGEDFEKQMPVLDSPFDLKPLIGLSTIHVLNVEKEGLAYVGFEFGCEWEEEHGLGVMSHGHRIIDVGAAEDSFSTAKANEDKSNSAPV